MNNREPMWQPIETAPYDTWILVCGGSPDDEDDPRSHAVARRTEEKSFLDGSFIWRWRFAYYDAGFYGYYENPTHWMHLPARPEI